MSDNNTKTKSLQDFGSSQMAENASLEKGFKSFLSNFNPETSKRETRKLRHRLHADTEKRGNRGEKRKYNKKSNGNENNESPLYNEAGIFLRTGEDLCDCLEKRCSGCHLPCPKCKSTKCGHECRSNREWCYTSITASETDDNVIKNPYSKE